MSDLPLACDLNAFSPEQRRRHDELAAVLFADSASVRELADGYAVRADVDKLLEAAEFVTLERLCCPFLTFNLRVEPRGEAWLEMGGSDEIKALLRHELKLT